MKRPLILAGLFLLAACGNGERIPVPESFGESRGTGTEVSGTEGDGENCTGETISQNVVLPQFDLGGIKGNRNIAINFCLARDGEFVLHTYATDNRAGLDIRFRRSNQDKLEVVAAIGSASIDYSVNFTSLDATQALHFYIDVHNSEAVTHLIIWSGSAANNGFAISRAIVNSAGGDGAGWFGTAGGKTLGYSGKDAVLNDISVSEVKFVH